jgi:hypothetical protein
MKKILYGLLIFALTSSIQAKNIELSKIIQYDKSGKEITNKFSSETKNFAERLEKRIGKLWNRPTTFNGYAKVKFIADMNAGNVVTFLVLKKKGDQEFNKYFREVMSKAKKIKLAPKESKNPIIEVILEFKAEKKTDPKKEFVIYDKKRNIYKNYIKYLVTKKDIPKEKIKKILRAKKMNFYKAMLYALYFEYEKKNPEEANKYFNIIIKRYPEKIQGKKEGLYVSEWLIKNNQNEMILKIFPERSCSFLKNPEKKECYYFRSIAKYKSGLDPMPELSISKLYFKPAEEVAKKLKINGGKK